MGLKDTGLSNNSPSNEAEVTPNRELEHPRAGEDSDSDFDETDHWGAYMPLSQNPNDGDPLFDLNNDESEDEELNLQEAEVGSSGSEFPMDNAVPELKLSSTSIVEEVWSKPSPKETDIEMSDKKIDLVKLVMLNVQLPSEAIPVWAKNIPEEDWKDHLLQRLNKPDKL